MVECKRVGIAGPDTVRHLARNRPNASRCLRLIVIDGNHMLHTGKMSGGGGGGGIILDLF